MPSINGGKPSKGEIEEYRRFLDLVCKEARALPCVSGVFLSQYRRTDVPGMPNIITLPVISGITLSVVLH